MSNTLELISTDILSTSYDVEYHYPHGVMFVVYHAGRLWKTFYSQPISERQAFEIEVELHLEHEGITIFSEELTRSEINRIISIEVK